MIDEAKLKRMQTRAQIAALASLVVFLVLIAFSASRLITLKGEVADVEQELAAKRQELEDVEQELAEAERKVEVHRELYGKMAQEDPGLARTATAAVLEADPEAAEILPRVYIHIRSEEQRPPAATLGEALERAGFVVPGIERLADIGPSQSELRYFHDTEREVTDAERAAAVLGAAGLALEPKLVPGFEDSTEIRPRHYELWLAPGFAVDR